MARALLFQHLIVEANQEDVRIRRRQRRMLRGDFSPFTLPDAEFLANYRLTKNLMEDLIENLSPLMPLYTASNSINAEHKILAVIRFYATGSYQRGVGNEVWASLSQPSFSRALRDVTNAFNSPSILQQYIKFPQTLADRNQIKSSFYTKFKLPGVVGCIDGTLVKIIRPTENEESYLSRKHYHSLNVQIICDPDLYITNVDASYPGATHDVTIWSNSQIKQKFENLNANGEKLWLLGDSGYPQREIMMTPYLGPLTPAQEAYNQAQMTARNTVERCIGVLKARWRCLLSSRALHYKPVTAAKIINACTVLHNIATKASIPFTALTPEEWAEEQHLQQRLRMAEHHTGRDAQVLFDNAIAQPENARISIELLKGRAARDALARRLNQEN